MKYALSKNIPTSFEADAQPCLMYLHHCDCSISASASLLHAHDDCAEIVLIKEGQSCCSVDSHDYSIKRGDAILIGSHILHSLFSDHPTGINAIHLSLSGLHLKGLEPGQLIDSGHSPILHCTDQIDFLLLLCDILEKLSRTISPISSEGSRYVLQTLVACLAVRAQKNPLVPISRSYNLGMRIKDFLDAHYLEDLKLTDIAAALHINPYYLSHTFKKVMRCSPIQYIAQRRIGEAQNLLITTDKTVTDIALSCGYHNSNYFQVVFNNMVGMPPGKYRRCQKAR
jgi:AraC-like DNA-binding protein